MTILLQKIIFLDRRISMVKTGLYDNIHKKRKRIKAGSGETMKRKGAKGRPSAMNFKQAALTAKNRGIG